jgi:hypothetical protein
MKRVVPTARLLCVLLLPFAALAAACTGYGLARELQRDGVPAQAEILSLSDTGEKINDDPVIRLEVEVRPQDRPPFKATIKHLLISNLEIPQYQPGLVIGVRFDPKDPSRVSIDLGPPPTARTGDPFRDNYSRVTELEEETLPPPAVPTLYRGSADDAADRRALVENNYVVLGSSSFEGPAADPRQAAGQGKRVGAALVVIYGEVLEQPGVALAPLPFHPRPPGYTAVGPPPADASGAAAAIGSLPPRSRSEHAATYWGAGQPVILGILMRALNDQEKAQLMRNDGIVVELVGNNSPAAAAHLQQGDIILAIDGKTILDLKAMPPFLQSVAGRKVRIDFLRAGAPLTAEVQLNPAAH